MRIDILHNIWGISDYSLPSASPIGGLVLAKVFKTTFVDKCPNRWRDWVMCRNISYQCTKLENST